MLTKFKILILFSVCVIIFHNAVSAQAGAGNKYGQRHEAYVDSIKSSNYKWIFPAWGKRITKKGFDVPFPVGIMLNNYFGSQLINITDLQVGFNGKELVPLDFIKFGKVEANIQSTTVRPDVWVLPFLDLYAIAGATWSNTNVEITAPFEFTTKANFQGSTFGLGTTFAGGFHGFITIIDLNHTWSHIEEIQGSIEASMFTPRVGYNFLSGKDPKKSIALWVGAPGIFINRTTMGTIDIGNLESDASRPDLEGIVNETVDWYQSLTPAQKALMKAIAQQWLDKLDGVERPEDLTVSYSLVKKPTSNWSMCIGGQVQFSHRWQVRTEVGFFGGRKSLLLSGNYRFRL